MSDATQADETFASEREALSDNGSPAPSGARTGEMTGVVETTARGVTSAARDFTPTPGQTVGPFFGYALPYAGGPDLVGRARPGAIRLHGTVYDGAGTPVPDALLEVWQADEDGTIPQEPGSLRRDDWTFTGFGRTAVDNAGSYTFTTVNPGATQAGRAPFFAVVVVARGLMNRLFTRCYLPAADAAGEAALAADPLLSALPDERRATLVAEREPDGGLRWDVRLQGDRETVFLTYPRH